MIEQAAVGKNVIKPLVCQKLTSLFIFQQLEIFITVDQTVHVDDGAVLNEITGIATTSHADDAARFGVCLEESGDVVGWIGRLPFMIGHIGADAKPKWR